MITDILIFILGSLISWLLYSKSSRDKRFESKLKMYEELSKKLSSLFLRYLEYCNGSKTKEEFGEHYLPVVEFVLSNKFVISEKVNHISMEYLQAIMIDGDSKDQARVKLNSTVNAMRSELGLSVIDIIEQFSKMESLFENTRKFFGK